MESVHEPDRSGRSRTDSSPRGRTTLGSRPTSARGSVPSISVAGMARPAIPWHVVCAFPNAVLVESRQRRATFLHRMTKRLEMDNVTVRRARFEALSFESGTRGLGDAAGSGLDRWNSAKNPRYERESHEDCVAYKGNGDARRAGSLYRDTGLRPPGAGFLIRINRTLTWDSTG